MEESSGFSCGWEVGSNGQCKCILSLRPNCTSLTERGTDTKYTLLAPGKLKQHPLGNREWWRYLLHSSKAPNAESILILFAEKVAQELNVVLEKIAFFRMEFDIGGLNCRKHYGKMLSKESLLVALGLWDRDKPMLAASTFLVFGATPPLMVKWLKNLTSP
ncbi:uncharacterized [Tachysurus ichikawai]